MFNRIRNWWRRRKLEVEVIRTKSMLPPETLAELEAANLAMHKQLTPKPRRRRSHQRIRSYPPTTKVIDSEEGYYDWLVDSPKKRRKHR